MSSELFENYEFEFSEKVASIGVRINALSVSSGEKRKADLRAAESDIDQAEQLLMQMEVELRNQPPSHRSRLQLRFKGYQNDVARLKRELMNQSARSASSNYSSGNQRGLDYNQTTADQKGRILGNTQRLEKTSERLGNAHAVAVESEQIGVNIMGELGTQREALVRTRGRLSDTDANLSRSRRILNAMHYRIIHNRIIMYIIILVLIGILGIVVYLKFFKK